MICYASGHVDRRIERKTMSDSIIIFAPAEGLITLDELEELTGLEGIPSEVDSAGNPAGYTLQWDDVRLQIQVLGGEEAEDSINGFQLTTDELLGGRRDKKARKIWRRAERMTHAIRCTVEPDWDDDRKAQTIIEAIMADFDYALMFANGTVYNENGNIEVGHDDSKPKYFVDEEDVEVETGIAADRKSRSIEQLKRENIPFIKHLPVIHDETLTEIRSLEATAKRAMCLSLIARRADGESYAWFQDKVAQYRLQVDVTPDEWEFAEDEEPPEYVTIKFSRRLESYWCLLWALGYIDNLSKPTAFANANHAHNILDTRSPDQFLLEAKLRDKTEILDAADLYYRYDWAVLDAELYGKKPPGGLVQDVVYERHYTLNWLRRYNDQAWDDITTDT